MKKYLLLFSHLFIVFNVFAQCPNNPWSPPLESFGNNFDHDTMHVHYKIDSSLVNNVWQIGGISKPGFPAPHSPVNALQTDTLNPYPTNNVSAVDFWNDSSFWFLSPVASISFWHHYEVDSLTDSLLVQFTIDSGAHWLNPDPFRDSVIAKGMNGFQISYEGIRNNSLHPYTSKKIVFTGSDTAWTQVSICFTFLAINPPRKLDSSAYGVRFLMKSDSVQQNKPGWAIDDVRFIRPGIVGAVNDLAQLRLSIFPVPSKSGEFNIEYPFDFVKGSLDIYDMLGHKMKTLPLSNRISIAEFPDGIYYYKASFVDHEGSLNGKLIK